MPHDCSFLIRLPFINGKPSSFVLKFEVGFTIRTKTVASRKLLQSFLHFLEIPKDFFNRLRGKPLSLAKVKRIVLQESRLIHVGKALAMGPIHSEVGLQVDKNSLFTETLQLAFDLLANLGANPVPPLLRIPSRIPL